MEPARRTKSNKGAGKIDAGDIGCTLEIRRAVKRALLKWAPPSKLRSENLAKSSKRALTNEMVKK